MRQADSTKIKFYGNSWCPDSHRAKLILRKYQIEFEDFNIETDEKALDFVVTHNKGYKSVPTIVFPDESVLVEPSSFELKEKLTNFKLLAV
ncbi:MAG: glutaredoxin family protein [Chloroflexota bacterium]